MSRNAGKNKNFKKGECLVQNIGTEIFEKGSIVTSNPNISTGAKALYFYFLFNPKSTREDACKGLKINKDTFYKYVKELCYSQLLRIDYYEQKGAVPKCIYVAVLPAEKTSGSEKSDTDKPEL